MKCPKCGSNNPDDNQFCGGCGTSLGASTAGGSTPQGMGTNEQEETSLVTIPEDAVIVLQSQWAYWLYTIPWLVLLGVSFTFDFFTFGILPTVVAIYIIGSRYWIFRKTAYILTEKRLIIFQGSLIGRNRIDVPFANLNNILVRPGMFGGFLGYTGVSLQLVDQRVVLLQYLPIASPLLEHLRARMNPDSPHEEEPSDNF